MGSPISYRGRRAIGELLLPNRDIERLIFDRSDEASIERAAVAGGMRSLFDDGMLAALAGETTVEEVVRCVRADA